MMVMGWGVCREMSRKRWVFKINLPSLARDETKK